MIENQKQIRSATLLSGKNLKGKFKDSYTAVIDNPDPNKDPRELNFSDEMTLSKTDRVVHPDMVAAFESLRVHLACLCQQPGFTAYLKT